MSQDSRLCSLQMQCSIVQITNDKDLTVGLRGPVLSLIKVSVTLTLNAQKARTSVFFGMCCKVLPKRISLQKY